MKRPEWATGKAEAASSAGLSSGRVATEVLYLLPERFVKEYQQLFDRALRLGLEGSRGDERGGEGSDGGGGGGKGKKKEGDLTVRGGGRKWKETWVVRDEKALGMKRWVDQELYDLARRIREDRRKGRLRCGGCQLWCDARWRYCAHCGKSLGRGD